MSSVPSELSNFSLTSWIALVRTTVFAWLNKVILAVLDQGLISGSNFVIGILLARWLTPEEYGGYALAFSIFLLISQFYMSLLLEPMAVFGGSTYRSRMSGYLGSLLWIHLGTVMIVFLILGMIALGAWTLGLGGNLPSALAAVMVAGPCILLFWLVRRAFYLDLSPAFAVVGGAFYCVVVLGGLFPIYWHGLLSSFTAFLLMGFGALLTSMFLLIRLNPTLRLRKLSPSLRETYGQHWDYGRWALATAALLWIPSNFYFPVLSAYNGMSSAGELKALMNLTLPIANIGTALSLLFQPYAARMHQEQGFSKLRLFSGKVTFLYILGSGLYWGVLVLFRGQAIHFLYGAKYENLESLIPWLAIASTFQLAIAGPTIGLRAMESPSSVFVACGVSSCVTVLAGIPLSAAFGLRGVILSMILSSLTCVAIAFVMLNLKEKRVAEAAA
jgi:O-antigen/teichoic acid export membrane protein